MDDLAAAGLADDGGVSVRKGAFCPATSAAKISTTAGSLLASAPVTTRALKVGAPRSATCLGVSSTVPVFFSPESAGCHTKAASRSRRFDTKKIVIARRGRIVWW